MKAVNIMNFVRHIDERLPKDSDILYLTTKEELEAVNEYGFENTFLLQYDAVIDERYYKLFTKNASSKTELGLWYEIVKPLTDACGLPYKSEMGWQWDWHIIPGFSMAYSVKERELLIDEAMRKFKEVFGHYPRTVASWVIDTHTLNYLAENYDIDAVGICRDQTSTDAYTLVGGYFNGAYYPSKNNIFTPAQSEELKVNVPVFRLLGPCPVHNYDNRKYMSREESDKIRMGECFTMEPVWKTGRTPENMDWFFKTYFENEDMGFSYAQLGQENSFGNDNFMPAFRMQLKKLSELNGVSVMKMADTGKWFKETYKTTPATSLVADSSWDTNVDVESVYYDCKNYVANLFRYESRVFIRALYLFDERIRDLYTERKCETFDAVFENLPIVDTLFGSPDEKVNCGLSITGCGKKFKVGNIGNSVLHITSGKVSVKFYEDRITVMAKEMRFYPGSHPVMSIKAGDGEIKFEYKGKKYSLIISGADIKEKDGFILIDPTEKEVALIPETK